MRRALLLFGLAALSCRNEQAFVKPEGGWQRMIEQPRAEPYEPSDFFSDGWTMRVPPAGAVPRSRPTGDPRTTQGVAEDGSDAAEIPIPVSMALLRRGRDRFDVFCAACHGPLGDGDSAVAASMSLIRPPNLHQDRLRAARPGQLYRIIRNGFGLMPSYARQLDVRDRWAVVAYVRALQLSQNAPLARLPPALREELRRRLR